MSTGTRLFFLDKEDRIHRISVGKFNRFYLQGDQNERFPEFAGQRVRHALVWVELEGRKVVGVKHIDYGFIAFNLEGRLDEEERARNLRMAADVLSAFYPNKENKDVIDASGRFAQKRYKHENRWKPTPEIEKALMRAILGVKDDDEPKKRKKSALRLV